MSDCISAFSPCTADMHCCTEISCFVEDRFQSLLEM